MRENLLRTSLETSFHLWIHFFRVIYSPATTVKYFIYSIFIYLQLSLYVLCWGGQITLAFLTNIVFTYELVQIDLVTWWIHAKFRAVFKDIDLLFALISFCNATNCGRWVWLFSGPVEITPFWSIWRIAECRQISSLLACVLLYAYHYLLTTILFWACFFR